ncbi:hypothetical protein GCM10027568_31780 [Humibacter soli]
MVHAVTRACKPIRRAPSVPARMLGMIEPRPIRFEVDTWLVMRNDKVLPKAVVQRVRHREGDR